MGGLSETLIKLIRNVEIISNKVCYSPDFELHLYQLHMSIEKKIIVQKLTKQEKDVLALANKYYKLICALGDLQLTERELQLVAFTAIKGNISYKSNKEDFCIMYHSSPPTINNMVSKLKKLNLLVKDAGKIKVNPQLSPNFIENNIVLNISISNG